MAKPKILLYEEIHPVGINYLDEHAEIIWASGYDEDTICNQVVDVSGIVIRANGSVTGRIMDSAPNLKVVGRHGVGVDNIELEAATERGIYVVNTPGVNNEAVAEHAVGLMLSLTKLITAGDKALRNGNWNYRYQRRGQEMKGQTLGIVGLGNIGYRVAQICHFAFDMEILYCDEVDKQDVAKEIKASKVELEELLKSSDYVSLHVPSLPTTRYLINSENIKLMKKTAYLINTSRGPVVDTEALIEALDNNLITGTGLDVYEEEPLPDDDKILDAPNTILTPHVASHTEEAMKAMAMVVEDVIQVINGNKPKNPVNQIP
ncbi:hydroxyacid dehydrogenase [Candidatus Poribacteria bacterium]|nr:hydroxyacid dehydrogenase [Candidatus Poribacteria bacterium]